MYSRIRSCVCIGIEGREVIIETDVSNGLPGINMVGLASATVVESKDRVKGAIVNSGLPYPRTKITINLMPAELRKNSSCLDLPMAVGILASCRDSEVSLGNEWALIGELALDGSVSPVNGALPMLMHLKRKGVKKVIVPAGNSDEAVLAGISEIYPITSLRECVDVILTPGEASKRRDCDSKKVIRGYQEHIDKESPEADFSDISGQENAKRAIVVAAAGRHGLLMVGSPGCGKTMLAGRIPSVMPAMSSEELIETAVIRSVSTDAGVLFSPVRPFRHPHHTIGRAGLLGGGSPHAVPGEITLAHNGVLFLDEICEFDRSIIDGLRIPLEEKRITHFRKGEAYTFPCDFQLVMASNPCPCGYYGDKEKECRCTRTDIERYQNKLSGPIMDRIDMKISMERVTYSQLTEDAQSSSSADMRADVRKAAAFALSMGRKGHNSDLTASETDNHCKLGRREQSFMREAYNALAMSPRGYMRTLRVARTIADLAESTEILQEHLAEALSYRM